MIGNKIIIFIGSLLSGGAERVVSEISALYADYFKDVIIVTYYKADVFYQIDSRIRLESVEQQTKSLNTVKNALWIRKFVKRESPDVFLSFLLPLNVFAIWSLIFTNTPVLVCERSDPQQVTPRYLRWLRNISYHFCQRIEVQTKAGKDYFSSSLQKKIFVIPNPNHVTSSDRDWVLQQNKENRIVTVGRLISEKNPKLLISAFHEISDSFPEYKLEFYGEGYLKNELQEMTSQLGLSNRIIFHGTVSDVIRHIASAKAFVLSSNIEGMPNALMEAMALGIPCIATDVSGARDIIKEGENGFIVPVNNKRELVDRMKQLLESEELRNRFSERSISVISDFDKEKICMQWLDFVKL